MITVSSINGFSHKGVRESNEDYIVYGGDAHHPDYAKVVVLCDGMGGHGHGEVASKVVAESVYATLSRVQGDLSEHDLQCALDEALEKLNAADSYGDEKKMGTTLVVVVVNDNDVLVGHVGDSRCYLFDENGIKKFRTKDHSKVAEAVEAEILTEEEARSSQYKNILTRCVMAGKSGVKIEVDRVEVQDDDKLLLCTDGVVDALPDEGLSAILVNRSVDDSLKMIDLECKMKSCDNYSAILVELRDDGKKNELENSQNDSYLHVQETSTNGNGEVERLRSEIAYLKNKSPKHPFRTKALWCFIGMALAFSISGVSSFVLLNRVYEQSKNDRKEYCSYKAKCDSIINELSSPKAPVDTLVLRREIKKAFNPIRNSYNPSNELK